MAQRRRQGLRMTDEKYLRVSKVAAALLTGLGAVVLAGWTLDIRALKSVLPDAATMKANTALCFMLFGVSLWLQGRIEGERRSMTGRRGTRDGRADSCENRERSHGGATRAAALRQVALRRVASRAAECLR